MKFLADSLLKKLWLTITFSVIITIVVSFVFSYLFYEKLYVDRIAEDLYQEGEQLANDYKGGPVSSELKKNIQWYNEKSSTEIFLIKNHSELNDCFLFEINKEPVITQSQLDELLKGNAVSVNGFKEYFNREVIAVFFPLLDQGSLEGILFLYIPLAKISELTREFSYLWMFGGITFIALALFFGYMMIDRLTRPLVNMKNAAKKVSQGDYSTRVKIQSNDEVGQLAAAFNQMSASIQQEDTRKRDFLADVSHELRTPISYIKGYSEGLASGIVKDHTEQQKYLKLINREATRMVKLVSDLLDLSKLDAGQYSFEKHPFPLAQLIEDFVQKYAQELTEKQITLYTNLNPDIIIHADDGRVEQILQNIMDNAVRYTDPGGEISITLKKHHFGALVEISDTGIGIPPEDLSKLTERFYRVDKGRARRNGGTGLGLSIVEKLVRLHGGMFEIKSEIGKGTNVRIFFPVV
ncbi:HAMP domain-containing sensor histidine kinase [Bacillus sp. B15-48]|uniref:sensor histidine kinase n=1 Tax=Bacillus sp. B15-48 TaxID=1548601 RepID=UPI00193FE189|nr:HAMP domain-containing sensor histidine kinase [Bacillus sp. B15-48]MBM4761997.1 HAMP domain-containing protein [Bacillus sp. B15-48]